MVERFALVLLVSAMSFSSAEAQEPVRIFAAASLTEALSEAIKAFEAENPGVRVVPQFGASNDLARQILAGAPAHLFFSADERQMDRLDAEGAIERGSRRDVLSNQLVIVEGASGPARIRAPKDLERVGKIALADPEAVPAGVYARRYLETLGLWQSLRARVVPTLDVRAALAALASGNVDAGFVYRTDALLEARVRVAFEVPRAEGPRIVYPLALVRGAGEPAKALHRYLASPEAARLFDRYGFGRTEEK
ncbi:MAG TPA: molybdate ABC transporter substrate-binding protein [Vicinamibacteria bacterium]|nr:molybdate ABC transporter substrate-binding protein [Vicinamibacteria bacterium]